MCVAISMLQVCQDSPVYGLLFPFFTFCFSSLTVIFSLSFFFSYLPFHYFFMFYHLFFFCIIYLSPSSLSSFFTSSCVFLLRIVHSCLLVLFIFSLPPVFSFFISSIHIHLSSIHVHLSCLYHIEPQDTATAVGRHEENTSARTAADPRH